MKMRFLGPRCPPRVEIIRLTVFTYLICTEITWTRFFWSGVFYLLWSGNPQLPNVRRGRETDGQTEGGPGVPVLPRYSVSRRNTEDHGLSRVFFSCEVNCSRGARLPFWEQTVVRIQDFGQETQTQDTKSAVWLYWRTFQFPHLFYVPFKRISLPQNCMMLNLLDPKAPSASATEIIWLWSGLSSAELQQAASCLFIFNYLVGEAWGKHHLRRCSKFLRTWNLFSQSDASSFGPILPGQNDTNWRMMIGNEF